MTHQFYNLIRESAAGQLVYLLSGKKLLKPHELRDDYIVPEKYKADFVESKSDSCGSGSCGSKIKTYEGKVLVDWDGPDDPGNPLRWPLWVKILVEGEVCALTLSSYMASAIFTPAEEEMLQFFGTTEVKLMLGLALFVWGYGISPLFISAMSESPSFGGRRPIFLVSQTIFVVLQIPTALSNHLAPFAVLRFLAGLCAGVGLSVGPASIGDMFDFPGKAYAITWYSVVAVCGPTLGPLLGAALTNAGGWRWIFWFLMILGGIILLFLIFVFPETSVQERQMIKARQLRARTGNPNIISRGEIKQQNQDFKQEIIQIVWYPIELCIREPVLDLLNLHLTLVYSVIYLFFEAFPIVFRETYHFTIVTMGAAYCSLMVGVFVGLAYYYYHLETQLIRPIQAGNPNSPEVSYGHSALLSSISLPVGLFIFGWAATPSAHWMGSMVGAAIFLFGTFVLFQSYYAYMATLYPTRYASAMSSNIIIRSLVSGAFPLFGRVFYTHTGTERFPVGWGSSIIGFASIAMIGLPIYFMFRGPQLRARARERYGSPEDEEF